MYWGSFDGYERATDTAGHPVWQTFLGTTSPPGCTTLRSGHREHRDDPVGRSGRGATSVLYVAGGDTKMYALNAATGAVLWSQSVGGNPNTFVWSSPAVLGNSVYIGVSSFGDCPLVQGQLFQLDRVTGAVQHTFNVVPNGCIGGGVWGSPTIDDAAGTIYFTTRQRRHLRHQRTARPGHRRGARFRPERDGLVDGASRSSGADSDFGSTPTLFNGVIGGQSQPLVGSINKNGVYYAFERDAISSGPVWRTRIATAAATRRLEPVTLRPRRSTAPPCTSAVIPPIAAKAAPGP